MNNRTQKKVEQDTTIKNKPYPGPNMRGNFRISEVADYCGQANLDEIASDYFVHIYLDRQ